jgi:hypothetical protein
MRKTLQYTGLGLLAVLVVGQLYHPQPNAGLTGGPQSIGAQHPVPPAVQAVLERACYDCHSNRTRYPWYASVQPVASWINWHVTEGKHELNFSEIGGYTPKRAARKLQKVADEVHDRRMPLPSYLLMHDEAKLSDAEVALVVKWAEDLSAEVKPH